jgi:hypothetical protein
MFMLGKHQLEVFDPSAPSKPPPSSAAANDANNAESDSELELDMKDLSLSSPSPPAPASASSSTPAPPPPAASSAPLNPFAHLSTPPVLGLRCFAPEGTPLQGRCFPIHPGSSSLGRKQSNDVTFSQDVTGSGDVVGLDSSISGCHAHIVVGEDGKATLRDGEAGSGKASTNGTWLRLSAMHRTSEPHAIRPNCEVLVGTVRFRVSGEEHVVERDVKGEAPPIASDMAGAGGERRRRPELERRPTELDRLREEEQGVARGEGGESKE